MPEGQETRYRWEVVDSVPGYHDVRHFYYPGASTVGGGDGVLVKVEPWDGVAWLGTFAFGRFGPKVATKVVPLPCGGRLCVVSRGAGYLVSANDPLAWEEVPAIPITDILEIPEAGLVVVANHTKLLAYGERGQEWCTRRLAWDGLKLIRATGRSITGEYWDFRGQETRTFEVDAATGSSTGGVEDDG